jgi:actin-related protein
MMEKFDVAAFYVIKQAILSLYALGRSCGTVLSIGDGVTQVYPIHEGLSFGLSEFFFRFLTKYNSDFHTVGYTVLSASRRLELAGRDLTFYLQKLLYEKGYCFTSSGKLEYVGNVL